MESKELSAEVAGKILDADFQNIVRKVAAGKPLTVAERTRIESRAAGSSETLAYANTLVELAAALGVYLVSGGMSYGDDLARSLSKHVGSISLGGLTDLSDAAAEWLGKYEGITLMLDGISELSDTAAEFLSRHTGELILRGLSSISVAAAKSLAKYDGFLWLGLTELSEGAAKSLSKHKGTLILDGLRSLSEAAARSLAKHQGGMLDLGDLTNLSDAAFTALSKYRGDLRLPKINKSPVVKKSI